MDDHRPLLDPRRHQPRASAPPAAATAPFRVPPGGRGLATAGVIAVIQPTATPKHLLDMIEMMQREVAARTGVP